MAIACAFLPSKFAWDGGSQELVDSLSFSLQMIFEDGAIAMLGLLTGLWKGPLYRKSI